MKKSNPVTKKRSSPHVPGLKTSTQKISEKRATLKQATGRSFKNNIALFNKDAIIFSVTAIIFFIILRCLYPVPDYIPDSRGYMRGALLQTPVGYRPMGISVFLHMVHNINPSYHFVPIAQFVLMLFSLLLLAHAFLLLCPLNKSARRILYGLLLLNPALIHLTNAFLADSLFVSLNIGWIAFMLYLFHRPSWLSLFSMLFLLWLSMFVRYNALVYPFIVVFGLLFVRDKKIRYTGMALSIAVGVCFYMLIVSEMEEETNYRVFSGFSGWQLGANAMIGYKASPHAGIRSDDEQVMMLDSMSRKYIDSMIAVNPAYKHTTNLDFLWSDNAPFIRYEHFSRYKYPHINRFQNWIVTSLVISRYARAVVAQYPFYFFKAYLLPNAARFIYPDIEVLAAYQAPDVKMWNYVRTWYGMPDELQNDDRNLPLIYNSISLYMYTTITLLFIIGFAYYLIRRKKWYVSAQANDALCFIAIFWIGKFLFDTLAAPIVYRYVIMTQPVLVGALIVIATCYYTNKKHI